MELNLNGKVVVVTGGSSGIGEETAMEFAREGCEVTIASRSEKKLAEAAGRFEVEGFQVHTQVVDVSKPEDISSLAVSTCGSTTPEGISPSPSWSSRWRTGTLLSAPT